MTTHRVFFIAYKGGDWPERLCHAVYPSRAEAEEDCESMTASQAGRAAADTFRVVEMAEVRKARA